MLFDWRDSQAWLLSQSLWWSARLSHAVHDGDLAAARAGADVTHADACSPMDSLTQRPSNTSTAYSYIHPTPDVVGCVHMWGPSTHTATIQLHVCVCCNDDV